MGGSDFNNGRESGDPSRSFKLGRIQSSRVSKKEHRALSRKEGGDEGGGGFGGEKMPLAPLRKVWSKKGLNLYHGLVKEKKRNLAEQGGRGRIHFLQEENMLKQRSKGQKLRPSKGECGRGTQKKKKKKKK